MKKLWVVCIIVVLALTACGQGGLPLNGAQFATETYVKVWISSWETHDAEKMLALYANDATYMDYGANYGPIKKDALSTDIRKSFQEVDLGIKTSSYTITPDGRFAALEMTLTATDKNGKKVSIPGVVILEFKDGKVINETDYYNGTPLE